MCTAFDQESEVLARITRLNVVRIRSHIKDIRNINDDVRDVVEGFTSTSAFLQIDHAAGFPEWIAHVYSIRDMPTDLPPESLVDQILWALEARRTYLGCLQALFPTTLPRWVYAIFKLGRYAIASMALLQFASEFPNLCSPMLVEAIPAPQRARFTISGEEMPLVSVLRRLASGHEVDNFISNLTRLWGVQDPEAYFRNICSIQLPVHAEMQLLNFYDNNPERRPSFRFIGVSKKSCYLCQRFLVSHPQLFSVSSCHQKLYLAWRPPPAANATIYRQYKSIVAGLSKSMEAVAKQDLQNRLGLRRRVPPDSTTGISVSGLMDLYSRRTEGASRMIETVEMPGKSLVRELYTTPSHNPIQVLDNLSPDEEPSCVPHSNFPVTDSFSITEMVFHVMRSNDSQRQDIIAIRDIMDRHSGEPSWVKLVDLLMDDSGVAFGDGEFLMVNDRIRVSNERQLLACLQYLRNAMVLNSEVYVHGRL